jgi:hypothetical protein
MPLFLLFLFFFFFSAIFFVILFLLFWAARVFPFLGLREHDVLVTIILV